MISCVIEGLTKRRRKDAKVDDGGNGYSARIGSVNGRLLNVKRLTILSFHEEKVHELAVMLSSKCFLFALQSLVFSVFFEGPERLFVVALSSPAPEQQHDCYLGVDVGTQGRSR